MYAADTFVTLVRRVRRGEVWHEAHREHVYQRLTDVGLSHVAVTGPVTVLSAACAALGLAAAQWGGPLRLVADGVVILVDIGLRALPAMLECRRASATKSAPAS